MVENNLQIRVGHDDRRGTVYVGIGSGTLELAPDQALKLAELLTHEAAATIKTPGPRILE